MSFSVPKTKTKFGRPLLGLYIIFFLRNHAFWTKRRYFRNHSLHVGHSCFFIRFYTIIKFFLENYSPTVYTKCYSIGATQSTVRSTSVRTLTIRAIPQVNRE